MKDYDVNIDMTWSENYIIKAKNKTDAKAIAWERFKQQTKQKNYKINAEEIK